ncbi:hypothetical protein OXB_3303 [Bacillus sp. OxB-1]|nr:hypothetical protein OXB_3303 [Bacillus sp. OxB-1]
MELDRDIDQPETDASFPHGMQNLHPLSFFISMEVLCIPMYKKDAQSKANQKQGLKK